MHFNTKALALTAGLIWGGALLFVGLANLVWGGYGQAFLNLMASVYPAYEGGGLNRASAPGGGLRPRGRGRRRIHLWVALQSLCRRSIVTLRLTAVSDAQHGGFTAGSSPVSWGSMDELFVNLTVSMIPLPVGVAS